MTEQDAQALVEAYLCKHVDPTGVIQPVICNDLTVTKDFGWVFFYESKKYLETGNFRDQLAGNAPLIVEKKSGKIFATGTAYPIEHYIQHFEKYGSVE